MKKLKFGIAIIFAFLVIVVHGQGLSKDDIELKYSNSPRPGRIRVTYAKNKSAVGVRIMFINEYRKGEQPTNRELSPGEERLDIDLTCNLIEAQVGNDKQTKITLFHRPIPEKKETEIKKDPDETVESTSNTGLIKDKEMSKIKDTQVPKKGSLTIDKGVPDFTNYIESIPFLSSTAIDEEVSKIEEHINSLRNWKDKDAYIREHRLISYINSTRDSLNQYIQDTNSLINGYIENLDRKEITNKAGYRDSIKVILTNRLNQRKENIHRLSDEINSTSVTEASDWKTLDWKIIGIGVGLLFLLIILFVWFRKANKKNRTTILSNNDANGVTDASSVIVVRKKTTSILRKQSLEDVIDNDAYLKIDCREFCDDSAVRRMYIKNTCIKDIYNMYAEDLRNPNNPKEDGCMVLGRWIYDTESNEYEVSLEHIVLPGDDAVFAEYELNFGGKIKLRVTEKLRKLRRETNLQYDLTCWVHSHPGLGVFFSNSDSNVQMQLKHPTHPNFLTAIVVDILTPEQEMGFFTFKRNSSINSKADLKKMYSLEELYKWAVESDRNSFKPEDHYNILADAKFHKDECYGIELSNGAIIDMARLADEQDTGLVGMIHGFSSQKGLKNENIAVTITKNDAVPDNELVGCFIMATHCSIPSIRKVVANYLNRIKFVLVYTTTDGLVISIPVINSDICTDEKYYGEQKLENLRVWTRRKR